MISPRAFINRHNTVTAGNRSHKAPLVVQATGGALATASVIYSERGLIRITVYPLREAWLKRWQSLHIVCRDENHHEPV
ncbi:Uncharacterised protein [Serratia proteamaculans]|nr:Uncharacterised protein [Serratia proteamaculans]